MFKQGTRTVSGGQLPSSVRKRTQQLFYYRRPKKCLRKKKKIATKSKQKNNAGTTTGRGDITQHPHDRLFRLYLLGVSVYGPLHLFAQRVPGALPDPQPDEHVQYDDDHHRDEEKQQRAQLVNRHALRHVLVQHRAERALVHRISGPLNINAAYTLPFEQRRVLMWYVKCTGE